MPANIFKFVFSFSFAGFVVPVTLYFLTKLADNNKLVEVGYWLFKIELLIFPSSIFMMDSTDQTEFENFITTTTMNIILYSLLGLLIWYGIYKQRWVLFLAGFLVVVIWLKLFL